MESVFNLQILLHFFAFWFTQLFVKLYRVGQKLPLGDGPPALGQRTHSQSLECPKRNCSCTGCQPCDGKWLLCWLRWVLPPWSRCGWLMEFVDICRRYEIREIIVLVYIYIHIYIHVHWASFCPEWISHSSDYFKVVWLGGPSPLHKMMIDDSPSVVWIFANEIIRINKSKSKFDT